MKYERISLWKYKLQNKEKVSFLRKWISTEDFNSKISFTYTQRGIIMDINFKSWKVGLKEQADTKNFKFKHLFSKQF